MKSINSTSATNQQAQFSVRRNLLRPDVSPTLRITTPISLVAALPLVLGGHKSKGITVAFGSQVSSEITFAATVQLPFDDASWLAVQNGLADITKSEAAVRSVPLLAVAYMEEANYFDEARFRCFWLKLQQLVKPPIPATAWVVSVDGKSAHEISDPAYVDISLQDETAKVQSALEFNAVVAGDRIHQLSTLFETGDPLLQLEVDRNCQVIQDRQKTSQAYRRHIEDTLFGFLVADNCDQRWFIFDERYRQPVTLPACTNCAKGHQCQDLPDDCEVLVLASWLVGMGDRRIREPVLKRIHLATAKLAEEDRVATLGQVENRLVQLIKSASQHYTVAATSMLALVAWQSGNTDLAKASISYGNPGESRNVLLQLVSAAVSSGLPRSSWSEIIEQYSLTKLRKG